MNEQSSEAPVLILLIDDDPVNARAIRQALEAGGVRSRLHIVGGEADAISYLERQAEYRDAASPDLLLYRPRFPLDVEPAEARRPESRERLRALTSELLQCEERERRRIAGYLHDDLGQSLAFMRIALESVVRSNDAAKRARAIEQITTLLDETIAGIQTLTYDLSPPVLYELGLAAALERLGGELSGQHGLVFELVVEGTAQQLSEDKAAQLFRVTRELLVNVVKHAYAVHVRTGLRWQEDAIEIEVKDDGTGFDLSILETRGQDMSCGLSSVHDRVEALNGRVEIDSSASSGTRVSLTVPMANT